MWIRSQNKTDLVDITSKRLFVWEVKGNNRIYVDPMACAEDISLNLGQYKTEARAIEVLDEIHDQLINATQCDIIVNGERITKLAVYQMPKE